jgi:hypothetical protein
MRVTAVCLKFQWNFTLLLLLLGFLKKALLFCKEMGMNVRDEQIRMWKQDMAYLKVIFWHSSEETERSTKTPRRNRRGRRVVTENDGRLQDTVAATSTATALSLLFVACARDGC